MQKPSNQCKHGQRTLNGDDDDDDDDDTSFDYRALVHGATA